MFRLISLQFSIQLRFETLNYVNLILWRFDEIYEE